MTYYKTAKNADLTNQKNNNKSKDKHDKPFYLLDANSHTHTHTHTQTTILAITTCICKSVSKVSIRQHVNVIRAVYTGHNTHVRLRSNALITLVLL